MKALLALAVPGAAGFYAFQSGSFGSFGSDAEITKMVPGQSNANGQIECWINMNFDRLPEGDPTDVRSSSPPMH